MEDIEIEYNENEKALQQLFMVALSAPIHDELIGEELRLDYLTLKRAIERARLYDVERYKKSAGGRKSASLLTPEERIARARKAGKARKKEQSLEKIKGEF